MTNSRLPALVFSGAVTVSIILAACSLSFQRTEDSGASSSAESSSSSDSSDAGFTPNVSYSGVLDEIGVTTAMQGTHKLTLDDGQIIILQSSDDGLDLDRYTGRRVEVRGSVQPTVEAGGTIMSVAEVTVLEIASSSESSDVSLESSTSTSSSSSSSGKMCGGIAALPCSEGEVCIDDPSDNCDPKAGGADCSGICVEAMVMPSSSMSSAALSSSAPQHSSSTTSKASASTSSSVVSSSAATVDQDAMDQQVQLMLKQSYDQSSLWTQKYCTSHIAFCIPVHKNWYFKSFGATTSNTWHVEFGMTSIDELNQGAIILNLVSGSSASASATSGQIRTQGSDVIGFKDWQDGTHFELIGDARLRAAVEYMLANISPYELSQ